MRSQKFPHFSKNSQRPLRNSAQSCSFNALRISRPDSWGKSFILSSPNTCPHRMKTGCRLESGEGRKVSYRLSISYNATMPHISSIVQQFPYMGLFILLLVGGIGFPFPEDTTLILCGFLIFNGVVRPVPACIVVYRESYSPIFFSISWEENMDVRLSPTKGFGRS